MAKFVLCLVFVAAALAADMESLDLFQGIVQFKELADHDLKMGVDLSAVATPDGAATDLGDTNQDEVADARATRIIEADHSVSLLAKVLSRHMEARSEIELGESDVSPFEEEDEVSEEKLQRLLKPSSSKRVGAVAHKVGRLLDYLGQRMMQSEPLTTEELNDVRAFYLDQTAHVLGEYAYDGSGSQVHQSELARQSADDEQKMADKVKLHMDQTDADMHMSNMGVDSHSSHKSESDKHDGELADWMSGGKGGDMGGKGGKGGDMGGKGGKGMMAMMMGGKGGKGPMDPLMNDGPPPRFDSIMQHLEEAGRLAAFVDQVEQSCELGQSQHESLSQLEAKEGHITAGIEQLLSKVKKGQLFSHDNDSTTHSGSAKSQLKSALTSAASKEDDAKIVQDAGSIAEGQITKTLKVGLAMKPKEEQKPKTEQAKAEQITTPSDPESQMTEDVHVPIEHLRDHSISALDQTLTDALSLYSKRHKQHKQVSVDEHKSLSAQLRTIAAHLMRKVQHSDTTEKKPATVKPVHQLPEPTQPPTKAATKVATKAPTEVAPPPVQVAAKPMVQGGAVKQFIWHVLGKNAKPTTAAPTLSGLLKQGVTLFNGQKLFFDVAKAAP